jgi:uncharacterized repeat protein (TIGR01451 family)
VSANGRHIFYAAAIDLWGNKSAPVSISFKIHSPSAALTSLEKKVNRQRAFAGNILMYELKVRNLTPMPQKFAVTDVLPDAVTYLHGSGYDPGTRTV